MNDTVTLAANHIDEMTRRAAGRADDAIAVSQRVANDTFDSLHGKVETLRDEVPGTMARAAARIDGLARRGIERASLAGSELRRQVDRAGDRSVDYVRDEPTKSVLIAAATGAVLAALIGMVLRSGSVTRYRH